MLLLFHPGLPFHGGFFELCHSLWNWGGSNGMWMFNLREAAHLHQVDRGHLVPHSLQRYIFAFGNPERWFFDPFSLSSCAPISWWLLWAQLFFVKLWKVQRYLKVESGDGGSPSSRVPGLYWKILDWLENLGVASMVQHVGIEKNPISVRFHCVTAYI